jgi:hypothetical protein
MAMDFPNAQLPELTPLAVSQGQLISDYENELRNLFLELFRELIAENAFDANVLGMAHLGSLNLVRKSVNKDGLVLLAGDREETATRYLYRAWKSRNNQGRGLHFLRTYLQLLFPNAWQVFQLAQAKAYPYPTKLIPAAAANSNYYLTSRIAVLLDYTKVTSNQLNAMKPVLRSVIPARLTLDFALLTTTDAIDYIGAAFFVSSTITLTPYGGDESLPDATEYMTASFFSIQTLTMTPTL